MNFSIIIPTKDRCQVLESTLLSLTKQDFPVNQYEIIVVDNNSVDKTPALLKKLQRTIPNLRYVTESKQGVSFSRNQGSKQATYQHLIFLDDDVKVSNEFLQGYEAAWTKHPDATAMGGKIQPYIPHKSFTREQQSLIQKWPWCFSQFDKGDVDRELQMEEFLIGPNMSCKKGGGHHLFDTRLGRRILNSYFLKAEEYEWCTRLMLQKKKVMYIADPRIKVKHLISIAQFTPEYIMTRNYFTGVEHYVMDKVLEEKFPEYKSFLKQEIKTHAKQLLSFKIGQSLRFFSSKYRMTQVLCYFFNGKYFLPTNE